MTCCEDGDGDGGGGGAWLRPWLLPPDDVCFLCSELCLWGSSGAPPPSTWDGPLEMLPECGLYGGGGGGAAEPPVGGLLEDGGGLTEL